MSFTEQTPTLELRFCLMCRNAICATNRFCRHCGASQSIGSEHLETQKLNFALPPAGPVPYRALSGALIASLVESARAVNSPACGGRFAKKMLSALVPIPIMLLIILVAPFDAYIATRQIIERA
ncbi:MAG: hypothetical protein L0229_05265 [Blastocatellia bacterium]|nr:hypothetical protein [Blastocatellia bacterium]